MDKNMRIGKLAKILDTNTRYLSTIINSEKNKTFNSYINSLRIPHIVYKIQADPQYLTYKVSYLAEVSGFVSQSSFTKAFKEEMGRIPSAFIKEEIEKQRDV
ncbi:MAG TPA: AraC family transcriptional regulator [Flavobacteriaceae bacterium]|nr:AraC family transcriptional regulator [Flavobacteriaceae bacterium]